ncbi:MAG: response regulator transcription factor [Waterburya sp.]
MTRIAVYDSKSITIAGLVSILSHQSNVKIVGSFVDAASLNLISNYQPDLLLLEQIPGEDLWWLEQWLSTSDLELAGILLTDSITTEEIGEYLALGFKAFLPRLMSSNEIIAAIEAANSGLIVIHPELAAFGENNPAITPLSQSEIYLTSREAEVLQLLGAGLDNKAIASTLQISKHTVKFHISSILSKLNVSSRTEAVTLGLRQGLIRL